MNSTDHALGPTKTHRAQPLDPYNPLFLLHHPLPSWSAPWFCVTGIPLCSRPSLVMNMAHCSLLILSSAIGMNSPIAPFFMDRIQISAQRIHIHAAFTLIEIGHHLLYELFGCHFHWRRHVHWRIYPVQRNLANWSKSIPFHFIC